MKCFLISPIGEEGSEIWRDADKVKNHLLRPVMDELGLELVRIDDEIHGEVITDRIFDHLDNDELVIADLTGKNANVFYEAGYRQKTGLPMVLVQKKGESIPFDVRHIQILQYGFDIEEAEDFKHCLKKAAEKMIDREIDIVTYREDTEKIGNTHKKVLSKLLAEYHRRRNSGESMTKARHFRDTMAVRSALFPEMDREDLDNILRELGDSGYINEEHADIMVMFFDLTNKAITE